MFCGNPDSPTECIPEYWLCDGKLDCSTGLDESPGTCQAGWFHLLYIFLAIVIIAEIHIHWATLQEDFPKIPENLAKSLKLYLKSMLSIDRSISAALMLLVAKS